MFSQKKKFYQTKPFFAAVIALLLGFGVWFNQTPADTGDISNQLLANQGGEEGENGAGATGSGEEGAKATLRPSLEELGLNPGVYGASEDWEDDEETDEPAFPETDEAYPYYLLQEDDGLIEIYFVDDNGVQRHVRTSGISFSLLSEVDQDLFRGGIIKKTEEDLLDLLQDFES